jgi:ABC-type Fe3+-hydroxamate transport system substrate-binding protein
MPLHYARKLASVSNPAFTPSVLVSSLRIVCLVPSITELLVDLGLAVYLVGRTGYCIHPAAVVDGIAKVGGTKNVNLQKIRKLVPTHVVVNVDENQKSTVDALASFVPQVVVTHPQSAPDNLALIDQLVAVFAPALAASDPPSAPGLVLGGSQSAMHSIAAYALFKRAAVLKDQILQRLRSLQAERARCTPQQVLYLIWQAPWMTVARDTYISRMLGLIGWHTWPDALGGDGISTAGAARYPVLTGDEPWLAQIDRVLLSSEPYSFNASHVAQVQSWLPRAQVQLVDGELLSWYGSRAILGLDYLAGLSAPVDAGRSAVLLVSPP